MIGTDEKALYCDMAETYHLFGLETLPIEQTADLAAGLREDSRIYQKMNNVEYPPMVLIMAHLADNLTLFRYGFSEKDKNSEKPFLFLENIFKNEEKEKTTGFETPEDFINAWNQNNRRGAD